MSRLILHRALASPPSRSVIMLADIINVKLELKDVNILKMEHKSPEFLKINPMGTVPVIQDGDFTLSESNAILKYLLQKYGAEEIRERLYPGDVNTRAIVDQCIFFNAGVFFNALRTVGMETLLGRAETISDKQKVEIETTYGIVEAYLQNKPYIASGQLTLADLSAGTTASAIKYMLPLNKDKFPKYADWLSRLEEEPFFKKTDDSAKFFGKLLQMSWDRNKQKNKQ